MIRCMHDVTLVTCRELPEPDPDEQPLLAALAAAGIDARMAAWDDPDVDWNASPLTVIRSTWNYADDRDGFITWAHRVAASRTVLRNPLSTISANTHKSYLAGLERAELQVVPTRWLARGGRAVDDELLRSLPWRHVVTKPAVGGGSSGVRAFDLDDDAELAAAVAHVEGLQARGEVLLQPRMESIVERGERDVVWIAGECTHVVTKLSRMEGEHERAASVSEPTEAERLLALRALRTVPALEQRELLYARVDLAEDEFGTLRIVEMELVEPSLFVAMHEPAMDRFVDALAAACGVTRT
jgi:hypothetical protein